MIINLKRLKLHNRGSEIFHLKEKGHDLVLGINDARFLEPIEVEIVVENTGHIMVGHGTINTLLQLPCSRCLKDFTYPVTTEFSINMVESTHSEGFNEDDDDIIIFNDDEVDITSSVEQAIFLAIPLSPVCKEDCRGLCVICGIDKNTGICSCQDEATDPRWDKLKNLQ